MSRIREELINRAFTQSRLQNLLDEQKLTSKLSKEPTITIGRDPGSGGHPIGKLIAKKLGFKFYDKKLIDATARSARKRKKVIAKIDEKTRNAIQDALHSLFNPDYVSDTTYIKHLTNTILSIGHQGKAVIIGRGSNFILPKKNSLHVYVTAPLKTRVQRAIVYEKISQAQAKEIITKITARRKKYVNQYFHKNYQNPLHYDLTLNTQYFDIETSADIIIDAFHKKFPSFKPSSRP